MGADYSTERNCIVDCSKSEKRRTSSVVFNSINDSIGISMEDKS